MTVAANSEHESGQNGNKEIEKEAGRHETRWRTKARQDRTQIKRIYEKRFGERITRQDGGSAYGFTATAKKLYDD